MIDNLEYYVKEWSLSDPQFLVETFTSRVYKVKYDNAPAIIKLLNKVGIRDEANGAVALKCFDGNGAVKLLRNDHQTHLLEFADGKNLVDMVKEGRDNQATMIIANTLNTVHESWRKPPPKELTLLEDRFRSLFERAGKQDSESIYKRAASVAEKLLSSQIDRRILHGDMHHENIIYSNGRGWLVIDPKGLYGERTFDAANVLLNPYIPDLIINEDRYLETINRLVVSMNLDRTRLLAFTFAYSCLSASWSISDNQDPSFALEMAKIAESHVSL